MEKSEPPLLPHITKQQVKEKKMPVVANACLLLSSLTGGALLLWWVMEFHRHNRQLWMVPFGLILTGTPIVVWFSMFASDVWRSLELLLVVEPKSKPEPEPKSDPQREGMTKQSEVEDLEK